MDFLKRLKYLTHTPQYKKKYIVLMWLSKYINYIGHDINENKLLNTCHILDDDYKNILAGNPLVSINAYNNVICYIKNLYYKAIRI